MMDTLSSNDQIDICIPKSLSEIICLESLVQVTADVLCLIPVTPSLMRPVHITYNVVVHQWYTTQKWSLPPPLHLLILTVPLIVIQREHLDSSSREQRTKDVGWIRRELNLVDLINTLVDVSGGQCYSATDEDSWAYIDNISINSEVNLLVTCYNSDK